MKRLAFAIPGDFNTPTGGYAYDRRMIAELNDMGWNIDVVGLGEDFPHINTKTRADAQTRLSAVPEGRPIVIDGLALGTLPDAAASVQVRNPLIGLVHHPLALESGLSLAQAEEFRASERAALAHTRRVIVPSAATARVLTADYDVAADRITVACPGTDPVAPSAGSRDGIVRLLAVGSLVPRKGYDLLIAALATLKDLPWRLTIAGDERDQATAETIKSEIRRLQFADRVTLVGAVSSARLTEFYLAADIFVLASRYEGYGMAYAEAIAHGLPVIGTRAGAIPDTVPSEASILVAPDDADALARALRRVIADKNERQRCASAARSAAARLPTWRNSAALFAGAIEAAIT